MSARTLERSRACENYFLVTYLNLPSSSIKEGDFPKAQILASADLTPSFYEGFIWWLAIARHNNARCCSRATYLYAF